MFVSSPIYSLLLTLLHLMTMKIMNDNVHLSKPTLQMTNVGMERLSNSPEITQLMRGSARIQVQAGLTQVSLPTLLISSLFPALPERSVAGRPTRESMWRGGGLKVECLCGCVSV